MKKPKHTPGPWIADDFCMESGHRVRVGTNDGSPTYYHNSKTLCECFVNSGSEDVFEQDNDHVPLGQAEANARLMAAAPELLEAAQLLEAAELSRQRCEECEDEGEPEACGTCFPKFDDARVTRRLAIAKATGAAIPKAKPAAAVAASISEPPCRQKTNICDPVAGECMRCHAAQGETCREASQ